MRMVHRWVQYLTGTAGPNQCPIPQRVANQHFEDAIQCEQPLAPTLSPRPSSNAENERAELNIMMFSCFHSSLAHSSKYHHSH